MSFPFPPEMQALKTLRNDAAIEIVRYVALHGPLARADIEQNVSSSPSTLGRLLEALVAADVLTATPDEHSRRHRFIYSVNTRHVISTMDAARDYVLGRGTEQPS